MKTIVGPALEVPVCGEYEVAVLDSRAYQEPLRTSAISGWR
ncbi:hypothetical protein [Bradyrhizobium sp.]